LAVVVLAEEVDRRGDAEVRGGIAGALYLCAHYEGCRFLIPPRRDDAVDSALPLGSYVQEARSLRSRQPLVTIAGVEVRADRVELEVDLRDRVLAVDDGREPTGARLAHDLLHGQQQRRLGRDVRDEDRLRPLGHVVEELIPRRLDER